MTKNGEEADLRQCLSLIESKLSWGASEGWVNYDFEKLSDAIQEATNVQLSVTTLKRIWGKLKYESAPTLTTLNTLAQFAGYEDWRTFKQNHHARLQAEPVTDVAPPFTHMQPVATAQKRFHYYWALLMIVPFALLGYALITARQNARKAANDMNSFSFRADKMVTEGVPNSVVFHYDARAAQTDSVFIVQTWDMSRKKHVPKDRTDHSAIYYYPGYFNTKLIADNVVVRTQPLWITTNGWLCLSESDPMPLYFTKEECAKNNGVEINENTLKKYNLALHPTPPKIRVYNQRNLGSLMSDNFLFETSLKNDFHNGTNVCQPVQVLIQCKGNIIIIPLAAKACVGNLDLSFCGHYVSSKDTDLSLFGTDLTQWTHLRIEVKNNKASIFVNNKLAYFLTIPDEATGIVGVQYRFNGTGAVKDTHFIQDGKLIPMD